MRPLLFILAIILVLSSIVEARLTTPAPFVAGKNAYSPKSRAALNPLPDQTVATLIPYSEFTKLSKENQGLYLNEVRLLMSKLAAKDEALQTQYQTAQWSALEFLFPYADAKAAALDDSDRRCVYAGQLSEMDINGRYCMVPEGTCKMRGQVMCNPVLYGLDKCVQANRSATSACERGKKSTSEILADIKSNSRGAEAYAKLRSGLTDYCAKPRPSQKGVCSMIRAQLARMDRVIGKIPDVKYADAKHSTTQPSTGSTNSQHARRGHRHAGNAETPAPDSDSNPPADDSATPDTGTTDVVVAPAGPSRSKAPPTLSLTRSSGSCQPAALVANMRAESKATQTSQPNFMDLQSARTLMCSLEPIPDSWIKAQRDYVAQSLKSLTSGQYVNDDRKNYDGILKNFNACIGDAQKLRSTGAGSVSGNSATLTVTGDTLSMTDADGNQLVGNGGGSVFNEEGLFKAKGISICNIQTSDNVQLAPAYSSSPAATATGAGAAQ